jgi:hypothetical protein
MTRLCCKNTEYDLDPRNEPLTEEYSGILSNRKSLPDNGIYMICVSVIRLSSSFTQLIAEVRLSLDQTYINQSVQIQEQKSRIVLKIKEIPQDNFCETDNLLTK